MKYGKRKEKYSKLTLVKEGRNLKLTGNNCLNPQEIDEDIQLWDAAGNWRRKRRSAADRWVDGNLDVRGGD